MALRDGAVDGLLFADASHTTMRSCGGWGAWICTTSEPGFTVSGRLVTPITSSTEAEMRALANGLAAAVRFLSKGAALMVHTDSANALRWILTGYTRARDWPLEAGGHVVRPLDRMTPAAEESQGLSRFCLRAAELELVIFTRHVRGHAAGGTLHADLNNKCDRLARQQMRAAAREAPRLRSTT